MLTYLSKRDKLIYKLGALFILGLFPFIFLYYNELPNQIPLALDFWGNIKATTEKNIFTSFRLNIMSSLVYAICFIAHITNQNLLLNNKELLLEDKRKLKSSISCIRMSFMVSIAIKTSLVSIGLLNIGNTFITEFLHVLIILSAIAGIVLLLCGIYKLYRLKSTDFTTLKIFEKKQMVILSFLTIAYLFILIYPFYS